jgi:hypothetical protein
MRQRIPSVDHPGRCYAKSSGMVDDCISCFERGSEHVEIRRRETTDGAWLILSEGGIRQSYLFRHLMPMLLFQIEIEAWLVQTGWSLTAFEAEWRLGHIAASS